VLAPEFRDVRDPYRCRDRLVGAPDLLSGLQLVEFFFDGRSEGTQKPTAFRKVSSRPRAIRHKKRTSRAQLTWGCTARPSNSKLADRAVATCEEERADGRIRVAGILIRAGVILLIPG
jgi:hypothetical protein